MSITFAPQFDNSQLHGWKITLTDHYADLDDWGQTVATFDDYQSAAAAYESQGLDPWKYSIEAIVDETPELNVSNGNAMTLLRELGIYDGELCGQIDPTDLLDRVLLLDAFDDEGTDAITVGGDDSATMIDCGRRAGTMNRYAAALRAVAEYAQARGLPVTYA